ncbi:MAG: hypothetical protein H7Z43_11160 [Clostridia bacterium]|nr:hypothetical protein [Deltaproteobacteria bacterium]
MKPIRASGLVDLLRDYGAHFLEMSTRPIPIGIVSYSAKKCDEVAIKKFVRSMFNALKAAGVLNDVALIGGFTDVGGIRASYAAADTYPQVEKVGIMAPPGMFWAPAQVDKGLVYGKKAWGEESPIFLDLISNGFMVGIGGGAQAKEEASWFIARNSDHAIIAEGFTNVGKDGNDIPGAVDAVEGGIHIANAAQDPVAAGYAAGKHIAKLARERRAEQTQSPLMRLALEASPKQIIEVDQWAKANTSRYRILRILNALTDKLRAAGVGEVSITQQLTDASFRLVENTFGIDNFAENARWQQRAKLALEQTGGDIARVLDRVSLDVMFASWFGIQEYQNKPGFFEENLSAMPVIVTAAELAKAHTLPAAKYAEIRLDYKTAAFLNAIDSVPEVFLGTKDEMELFYRAKGYQFAQTLHDSNGSSYYLLSNGDSRQVVVHGVDSEARLAQLSTLMSGSGVDPSRIVVRGRLDSLRHANRNMLELALANMKCPIAGVVIGNKGNVVDELAAMASLETSDMLVEDKSIGPFKFKAVTVRVNGHEDPQLILAFSPAYGELSQDLVDAAITAGARNFMLAGAGGSLVESDALGVVHQVAKAEYYGTTIDLAASPSIHVIDVPGAPRVTNIFSPAPLEQTQEWAAKARAKGMGDVDQETGPVFVALQEAAASGHTLNVMTGLYQSDVVGQGALASGTVDNGYAPAVRAMANQFFAALGIASVESAKGSVAIADARPGLLAAQMPLTTNINAIDIPVPDLATIGDSASLSSVQQFKGQKRVIQVESRDFGGKERQVLRSLLRELNAAQFWVAVAQSDRNHGEILDIAKELGFETILVATSASVTNDEVLGKPTFIIKEPDDAAVDATLAEFARDGKNDAYEANSAQHYVLHLGSAFEPKEEAPGQIFSSLIDIDDVPELADDIRRESRAGIKAVKTEIKQSFEAKGLKAPAFHAIEEVKELFNGRKPLMLSGASRKSWPLISPEHKAYTKYLLTALAHYLDPSEVVVVTGGTDHGVEKIAHEVFGKAGFTILGTICENTHGNEIARDVGHLVVTGINWFGVARPAYREIVEAFNGENLTLGGGAILRDMIQLALRLNLRVHNWNGPEGASTEAAKAYPAHAFGSADELFTRMGIDAAKLPHVEPPPAQTVRCWTPDQIIWAFGKSGKSVALADYTDEIAKFCALVNEHGFAGGDVAKQTKMAMPALTKALADKAAFADEFAALVNDLETTARAQIQHGIEASSVRDELVERYSAAADAIAALPRESNIRESAEVMHVDEIAQAIAIAAITGEPASFSPLALRSAIINP